MHEAVGRGGRDHRESSRLLHPQHARLLECSAPTRTSTDGRRRLGLRRLTSGSKERGFDPDSIPTKVRDVITKRELATAPALGGNESRPASPARLGPPILSRPNRTSHTHRSTQAPELQKPPVGGTGCHGPPPLDRQSPSRDRRAGRLRHGAICPSHLSESSVRVTSGVRLWGECGCGSGS